MTLHALAQYLQYRWKAQNRHGVHSPFAYSFVEDVVENRKHLMFATGSIPDYQLPGTKYNMLLSRIITYYNYPAPEFAATTPDTSGRPCTLLIITATDPGQWQQLFDNYFKRLTDNSCVVIANIHNTSAHTAAWQQIYKDARVHLSIDMYGIGLLFFRKEFKVKQHFILKNNLS